MMSIVDRLFSFFSTAVQRRLLIFAIVAVPFVVHSSPFILHRWSIDAPWIHTVRSVLLIAAVIPLFCIIGFTAIRSWSADGPLFALKRGLFHSFAVAALLTLLVVPSALGIMGAGYALMSQEPLSFYDASGQLYQRLLMPAFAYAIGFRGPVLYHLLSILLTVKILFVIHIFFSQRGIALTTIDLVSIGTSSFLITQLQSPGYTEPLAFLFLLLTVTVRGDALFRAAAVLLAVLSHESIIVAAAAVAIVFHSRQDLYWIAMIGGMYGVVWIASMGFDLGDMLLIRSVGGRNTAEWLIEYPVREFLGLFFSMKLLWLFIFVAWQRRPQERKNITLLLVPGIVLTLLAVDTSRMAGFGFMALLFSIYLIKQHGLLSDKQFAAISLFNICVPAVYVGLNSGIVYFAGLYQWLMYGIYLR